MNPLEKQIAELTERIDALELAVWSLEKSDERNWEIIKTTDDTMQLLAEAKGVNLPKLKRFFDEAKRRLGRTDRR